jgi:DNA-binding NarL/FixJ family response regulator
MTNFNIKILLIGDYSIFRNALRMLIETKKKLKVVGETSDLNHAPDLILRENPDLILIDLPEAERTEIFTFMQKVSAEVPVLILAGRHSPEIYQKCMRLGISGLVLKEKTSETLFRAIEKVYEGELWYDRTVMGQTIRQLINEKYAPQPKNGAETIATLSDRERQVVDLICKGLKNKIIADQLFITETTVRHHLTSIFNKLEVTSRLELVIYAFRHNMAKIQSHPDEKSGNGYHLGNGY